MLQISFSVLKRLNPAINAYFIGCTNNKVLQREIPMAWGTTTDSLTPEINPFQYAIEIHYLTLKDQTMYLIPDG